MSKNVPAQEERWNVEELFSDPRAFEAEFAELAPRVDQLARWRGRLGESAAVLADALDETGAFSRRLARVHIYAMLRADLDMRSGELESHRQRVEQLHTQYSVSVAWMQPELLALEDPVIEDFLVAEPRLAPYEFYLRDLTRFRPHVLGSAEEKLLATARLVTSTASDIYQTLLNAEMSWPQAETPEGDSIRVTPVEFHRLRTSPDRPFRQRLYEAFLNSFSSLRETFGQSLFGAVKSNVFIARARRHDSSLVSALHKNHVPVAVYSGLIDHVRAALPLLHRYQRLRATALGLKQLETHDLYCPLGEAPARSWTPQQARQDVVESVRRPLGADYARRLERAFDARWVDWHVRDGKRIGAYSAGSAYDVHPFVLMNYTGEYDSVSTLAHEMGHAMHSDFSNRRQPFPKAQYSIFVAEVASTVNEALLAARLLERADSDDERLFLLTNRIDSIRGTLFRQTMFAEFERCIHRRVEQGEALTGQQASEIYRELLSTYHGWDDGAMKPWDLAAIEWASVPHFYYNFYVYQYATGIIAAEALSQSLLAEEPGAAERYLEFLAAGGSKHPLDVLRIAGVDLQADTPYQAAFKSLERMLDDLESLLQKRARRATSLA